MIKLVLFLSLLVGFTGCFSRKQKVCKAGVSKEVLSSVSIISLLSNPREYQDRKIRIKGFLVVGFESNAIYFHEEDYNLKIAKNAIWVDFPKNQSIVSFANVLSKKYILLEGVFDANIQGHMNAFGGRIHSISRIEPLVKNVSNSISN